MTQTKDLIKKMADFFTGEEFYEKGEDARLELSPDDVRCMNEVVKACGNAIDRQAVLDAMRKNHRSGGRDIDGDYIEGDYSECLYDDIIALSPVTPQSKTGRWIKHDTGHSIYYDCSLCSCVAPCTETADKILWKLSNFCPDCGSRLQEVEE